MKLSKHFEGTALRESASTVETNADGFSGAPAPLRDAEKSEACELSSSPPLASVRREVEHTPIRTRNGLVTGMVGGRGAFQKLGTRQDASITHPCSAGPITPGTATKSHGARRPMRCPKRAFHRAPEAAGITY